MIKAALLAVMAPLSLSLFDAVVLANSMVPVKPPRPDIECPPVAVSVKVSLRRPVPVNVLLIAAIDVVVFALRKFKVDPAPMETAPVPRPVLLVPLIVLAMTVPELALIVSPPEKVLPVLDKVSVLVPDLVMALLTPLMRPEKVNPAVPSPVNVVLAWARVRLAATL